MNNQRRTRIGEHTNGCLCGSKNLANSGIAEEVTTGFYFNVLDLLSNNELCLQVSTLSGIFLQLGDSLLLLGN
jgi:hypothetical protein